MTKSLKEKIEQLRDYKKENRLQTLKKRLGAKNLRKYRYYFIGAGFFLFFCFLFLLFKPIIGKTWLEYPLSLRAEIAWSKWQISWQDDCYGQCLIERAALSQIVLKAWDDNQVYWDRQVFKYFKNSDCLDGQTALIDMSLSVYSPSQVPIIWQSVVYGENFSNQLRYFIISRFAPSFSDDQLLFIRLASIVADQSLNIDDRRQALRPIFAWLNPTSLDFCLNILSSDEGPVLKTEALKILSAWPVRQTPLLEMDLDRLANLALDENLGLELRPRLVWLLADYYQLYPDAVIAYLELIYNNQALDVFSRGFAADSLNQLADFNLTLPSTSQADWEVYYSFY